jgi:opacity protein-like surface antigen
MKRLFLLTAIAGVLAFSSASAQNRKDPAMGGAKLSAGVEFGLPTGDFSNSHKLGIGGSLVYIAPIADNLKFTANAGYISFSGKEYVITNNISIKQPSASFIPVKAGLRYYFIENFYGAAELGAVFAGKNASGTAFAYSPGIGIEFPIADKSTIDLGARYEGWSNNGTLSFFGIRAAINFGL